PCSLARRVGWLSPALGAAPHRRTPQRARLAPDRIAERPALHRPRNDRAAPQHPCTDPSFIGPTRSWSSALHETPVEVQVAGRAAPRRFRAAPCAREGHPIRRAREYEPGGSAPLHPGATCAALVGP